MCIQQNITQSSKKNDMPFAATWMDLEMVILSEINQKKANIVIYKINILNIILIY